MTDAHRVISLCAVLLCAGVALAGPAGAAQRPNITLQLTADDGTRIPSIDVSDLSISMARAAPSSKTPAEGDDADKANETPDQAAAMLDLSALSNPALVNWAGKGGANSTVELKVTAAGQATTYVLTGITTWSLSASHNSNGGDGQVSLSLGAKHLTINGTTVN